MSGLIAPLGCDRIVIVWMEAKTDMVIGAGTHNRVTFHFNIMLPDFERGYFIRGDHDHIRPTKAFATGHLMALPDIDGLIRRVAMIVEYDGNYYGLPMFGCANILYYRQWDQAAANATTLSELTQAVEMASLN